MIEINRHFIWRLSFNIFDNLNIRATIDYSYFVEISSLREPLIIPGIVSEFHILVQNNN